MGRKAQTGVVIAIGGLIFGLMLSPIPNVASEYVLQSILKQMDYHMSRQEAAIDGVQMTSDYNFPNFNPNKSYLGSNKMSGDCNATIIPGAGREIKFDNDPFSTSCQLPTSTSWSTYNDVQKANREKARMWFPPKISFYLDTGDKPNGLLISPRGGFN